MSTTSELDLSDPMVLEAVKAASIAARQTASQRPTAPAAKHAAAIAEKARAEAQAAVAQTTFDKLKQETEVDDALDRPLEPAPYGSTPLPFDMGHISRQTKSVLTDLGSKTAGQIPELLSNSQQKSMMGILENILRGSSAGKSATETAWADGQFHYTREEEAAFLWDQLDQADGSYKIPTEEERVQQLHNHLTAHMKTIFTDLKYLSSYDQMNYMNAWKLAKENHSNGGENQEQENRALRAAILFLASDLQKLVTVVDRVKMMNQDYIKAYIAGTAVKYTGHLAAEGAKRAVQGAQYVGEKARNTYHHYKNKYHRPASHPTNHHTKKTSWFGYGSKEKEGGTRRMRRGKTRRRKASRRR